MPSSNNQESERDSNVETERSVRLDLITQWQLWPHDFTAPLDFRVS